MPTIYSYLEFRVFVRYSVNNRFTGGQITYIPRRCGIVRLQMIATKEKKGRERFFYVPLPKKMGEEIDELLDKHGDRLSLLSRNDLVRAATREYMEKIRKESKN